MKQMVTGKLSWRRPKLLRREYLLLDASEVVIARLKQIGVLRSKAEIAEKQLRDWVSVLALERTGIVRQQIHVKRVDPRFPAVSRVDLSWKGEAQIELREGRRYVWVPDNFWHTAWTLRDEGGIMVANIKRRTLGYGGSVVVGDNILEPDEMNLLLYLGWYLVIIKMDDAAASAAAAG